MTSRMLMNTETKSNKAYLFSYNGFKYTYINESNNLSKTIQMYIDILYELENKAQIGNDFID